MKDVYTVVFIGHRYINEAFAVENRLIKIITELLSSHEYVEFLMGRDGEFDLLAASVVRRAMGYHKENGSLVWVLPYETAELRKNVDNYMSYYDEIEICEESAVVHPKSAFKIRNCAMLDRANEAIFYIEHTHGVHMPPTNML